MVQKRISCVMLKRRRNKVIFDTRDRAADPAILLRSHLSTLKETSDCQLGRSTGLNGFRNSADGFAFLSLFHN